MRVFILASSSFAARDLPQQLTAAGNEVWTFNRNPVASPGTRDLAGSYSRLAEIAGEKLQACDVLINYAIVKNGTIEQNLELADVVLACARRLSVRRFIHISSISVLPSVTGTVDERTSAVAAKWKGIYSRVKSAVEQHIVGLWKDSELIVVRPGFILGSGMIDSMVGIGRRLPTGQVLGLGNRRSLIPIVSRATVNKALVLMASGPLTNAPVAVVRMLVASNVPSREEYLRFQCTALGRGWNAIHIPVWLWRIGLACASVPASLWKRRMCRLVKLFEHNLNVRNYDCSQTQSELRLDFSFDWQSSLQESMRIRPSPTWPSGRLSTTPPVAKALTYFGMGRIVRQRHLPAARPKSLRREDQLD